MHDPDNKFLVNCNLGTVELEQMDQPGDIEELRGLITDHVKYTGSAIGRRILDNWDAELANFVKVMPIDYKRVLMERMRHDVEEESPVHNGTVQEATS